MAPEQPIAPEPTLSQPTDRTRFKDRVLGMRAVIGVAVASLILGGAGGAALGAISSGGDDNTGFRGGPGGMNGGPGGTNGGPPQQPPGVNGQ
jgi:hypothetical protein